MMYRVKLQWCVHKGSADDETRVDRCSVAGRWKGPVKALGVGVSWDLMGGSGSSVNLPPVPANFLIFNLLV
jgi:hypothetical protein